MYRSFPVGFLLFWATGAELGAPQIGTGQAAPSLLIVDGRQRLTSLFAVMTGSSLLKDDYTQARIRLAFRPADATFAVTDLEQGFPRFRELQPGDADGFCRILDEIIGDTLAHDFWAITLPIRLATSAAKSPALLAYLAALNIHDADALMSTTKIR